MNKKVNIFKLVIAVIIPLAVGMLSSFITKDAMMSFNAMRKPPLAPPGILFPIVWSILYVLMGISSYIIFEYDDRNDATRYKIKNRCLLLYVVQLIFNFFWSIIFFKFKLYFAAFVWLIILWILVFILIVEGRKISRRVPYLLIPYLIWMTFAAYLNIWVAILNLYLNLHWA